MLIIPSRNYIKKCFESKITKQHNLIRTIIWNESHTIILQKEEISEYENNVEDTDTFKSMIVEMSDKCRLITKINPSLLKENFIIRIRSDEDEILNDFSDLNIGDNNNHLFLDLLATNEKTISYLDFRNNSEIDTLIKYFISFARNKNEIIIINRELRDRFTDNLPKIHYYTLNNSRRGQNNYFFSDVKEWRKKFHRKPVKVYFTSNRRTLHERKIIAGNLIITFDNDFENIYIEEETWIINFKYDKDLSQRIFSKLSSFKIVP